VAIDWKDELRLFPTLRGYRRQWIGRDLTAGATFGAVTMPGQLATAHLAGMPPITGLYGFLVATIVGAALSTNRHLALGVDSTVAPILAAGLVSLGAVAETEHYIGLAVVTAFLVGIVTMVIGVGRMGWVGDFLSRPVMIGFFGGIAVIIIVHQLPGILGVEEGHGRTVSRLAQLAGQVKDTNIPTLILGTASLVALLGIARINRRIPGALIVLALSTLAMSVFKLTDDGVAVLGPLDPGLPSIHLPPFSYASIEAVATTVLIIATLCLAQTAATTRSAANLGGYETDVNADFRALGTANILSSLVGSFTINASPPSTTIIAESRAKSQLASLVASAMVVVVLIFSQIIEDLPMATLSAVLIYIAIKIFRVDQMRATRQYSWKAFALMLIALLGTALVGIVVGVLFAVIVALPDEDDAESDDQPELLVLDARRIDDIDFTGAEALSDVAEVAALRDVPFLVVVQHGRTQRAFQVGGFSELLGRSRFFDTIPLAIAAYPNLAVNRQKGDDHHAPAQT
jgi:sulfate permease, SulP family